MPKPTKVYSMDRTYVAPLGDAFKRRSGPFPQVGSKFTGPNNFHNTQTGEFWQVLPPVDGFLQQALLTKRKVG